MIPPEHFEILVVDDQGSMRDLTCAVLRSLGYRNLAVAHDGQEALNLLEKRRPHLVLMDVEMPVLDGFETLGAIRSGPNADLPVIMLTSRSDASFVQRAAALKIAGYVIKPTSPNILGARVSAVQRTLS